jgi:hypothetical protein
LARWRKIELSNKYATWKEFIAGIDEVFSLLETGLQGTKTVISLMSTLVSYLETIRSPSEVLLEEALATLLNTLTTQLDRFFMSGLYMIPISPISLREPAQVTSLEELKEGLGLISRGPLSYESFVNVLEISFYDESDLNRPQFGKHDWVSGGALLKAGTVEKLEEQTEMFRALGIGKSYYDAIEAQFRFTRKDVISRKVCGIAPDWLCLTFGDLGGKPAADLITCLDQLIDSCQPTTKPSDLLQGHASMIQEKINDLKEIVEWIEAAISMLDTIFTGFAYILTVYPMQGGNEAFIQQFKTAENAPTENSVMGIVYLMGASTHNEVLDKWETFQALWA